MAGPEAMIAVADAVDERMASTVTSSPESSPTPGVSAVPTATILTSIDALSGHPFVQVPPERTITWASYSGTAPAALW